jgi:hypothetical protein
MELTEEKSISNVKKKPTTGRPKDSPKGQGGKPCPGVMGFACDTCHMCGHELHGHGYPEIQRIVSDKISEAKAAHEPIKYKDSKPMKNRPRLLWQINFDDGEKLITTTRPSATVENVVEALKKRYPDTKFKVGQVDTGTFKLAKRYLPDVGAIYRSDSRWITQDGLVEL